MKTKQILRWIDGALRRMETRRAEYTCHAFHDLRSVRATIWYNKVLEDHCILRDGMSWDAEFTSRAATEARILWLAFLRLWVETGEAYPPASARK